MNFGKLIVCSAAAAALTLGAGEAFAQGRGMGAGEPSSAPPVLRGDQQMDRTRDRLDAPDQDRIRDRDRDQTGDMDRLRDRDRLTTAQAEVQLGAWSLLSEAERAEFHRQMQSAASAEQREQIRAQHRRRIEERARELGVDAPFGGSSPSAETRQRLMLSQLLTEQERLQFRDQMRSAATEQERARIRAAHQNELRERAREMGVDLPPGFGGR